MRRFSLQKSRRSHPVIVAAAMAVITFSLLGIGAITGLIPSAYSDGAKTWQKSERGDGRNLDADNSMRRTLPLPGALAQSACTGCGVVDAIRAVRIEGNASGFGAVVGGAFAGHAIEKNVNRRTVYRVTVRMDDGSFRTVSQPHSPTIVVGSRVRLAKGSLVEQS